MSSLVGFLPSFPRPGVVKPKLLAGEPGPAQSSFRAGIGDEEFCLPDGSSKHFFLSNTECCVSRGALFAPQQQLVEGG